MLSSHRPFLLLAMLLLIIRRINAGYYYDRPQDLNPKNSGHKFGTLSTVIPLPPVPSLPPLPTPPGGLRQTISDTSNLQYTLNKLKVPTALPFDAAIKSLPISSRNNFSGLNGRSITLLQPPSHIGIDAANDIYSSNNGQLKQYAVIEIIENDIENNEAPFLKKHFFERLHSRIDTSSIGADAFSGPSSSFQVGAPSNYQVIQPQSILGLNPILGDSIALGSGGLGYIRLANGNIYLGSGSLGYIRGQQLLQSNRDARSRFESSSPDVLHFGHGSIGETL